MRQPPDWHISRRGSVAILMSLAICLITPGEAFAKRVHHHARKRARGPRAAAIAAAKVNAKTKARAAADAAKPEATPPAADAGGSPTPTEGTPAAPGSEAAPPPPPPPEPGSELSVYVLTMGPGDHPFFKFGHDAIWIQDRAARTDRVYNFGTFRFDSPKLIPEFIRGRLTYWLSVSTIQQTLRSYAADKRSVEVQELGLDGAAKLALKQRLDENALPQNRDYKYDYFLDNCSTRVRDAIDVATGGRLRASAQGPARLTLRGQALRMTADVPWLYLALYVVLGPASDRAVDRWAEMFIPQELARGLRAVTVQGSPGQPSHPLVKAQQTLFQAKRPPPLEQPPERAVTLLLAGLAAALVFFVLGGLAAGQPVARVAFGAIVAIWGLVVGFVGCFLLFAWLATDHQVVYRNQNILLCAPFAIALCVLGVGVALGFHAATRKALVVTVAAAALATLGALIRVLMISAQDNGPMVAFLVPAWIGLAAGLYNIRRIQTLR